MNYMQMMYTYAPAWGFGGPTRLMYDYARWMAKSSSRTIVIAGDINHDYGTVQRRDNHLFGFTVLIVRVYFKKLVAKSLNCVSPQMFLIGLRQILRWPNEFVIHIAEFRSPVFIYAILLRSIFPDRVKIIHSAFGMLYQKNTLLRRVYDFMFMRLMLKGVSVALVQNSHESDEYYKLLKQYDVSGCSVRLFPLHATLSHKQAHPRTQESFLNRRHLREQYGIPLNAFVCLFVGRINEAKGLGRAVSSFLAFRELYYADALFLIVGRDDGYQEQLEMILKKNGAESFVRIINNVYDGRFDYYTMADVFLGVPTIYEETMLAAVEALACGTPVVLSVEADMPYLEGGLAGRVLDFSIDNVSQGLLWVMNNGIEGRIAAWEVSKKNYAEESASVAFGEMIKSLQSQ